MPRVLNRFRLGFEIEGFFPTGTLYNALRDLLVELYGSALIGTDSSLELNAADPAWAANLTPRELRTPPLPAREAVDKLNRLMDHLRNLTRHQTFHTNETCGFHVNLSYPRFFLKDEDPRRRQFAYLFLRRFKTRDWLREFGRANNDFAEWRSRPGSLDDLFGDSCDTSFFSHYCAVSLQKLDEESAALSDDELRDDLTPETRRIEVRVAGGKDYHRHPKMGSFLDDILDTCCHAADAQLA